MRIVCGKFCGGESSDFNTNVTLWHRLDKSKELNVGVKRAEEFFFLQPTNSMQRSIKKKKFKSCRDSVIAYTMNENMRRTFIQRK